MTTPPPTDGRHARRERGRVAVIDAAFELLEERGRRPTVDDLAQRAGVSVSSIFRYFGSLDDLQVLTFRRFIERFEPLFHIPSVGEGGREERIRRFVDARLDLYETVGGIMRVARARAIEQPKLAEAVTEVHRLLADQVREHFAAELAASSSSSRSDHVALIDALASAESWDLMVRSHGRTRRQIKRVWVATLEAVTST